MVHVYYTDGLCCSQCPRRRTIYLTIMSALDFEEAGHKLLKMVGCLLINRLARWSHYCWSRWAATMRLPPGSLSGRPKLLLISVLNMLAGHPRRPGDGAGHHDHRVLLQRKDLHQVSRARMVGSSLDAPSTSCLSGDWLEFACCSNENTLIK